MSRSSLVPDVIDALVTLCKADTGLQADNVAVYDGPQVTDAPAQNILWIGMDDPDSENAPIGAEAEQNYPALGTRARDEEGTIHCVAESWDGGRDIRAVRLKVRDIVAGVERIVRNDVTLGGVVVSGWAQVSGIQLRQNNVDSGAVARWAFHVSYRGRI